MTEEIIEVLASNPVKTAEEIEAIRAAQAITDAAYAHIIWFIKPGVTEKDVAAELDRFMLEQGADDVSFPTIVAFGPHGVNWHHEPIDQPLFAGMQLVMDFGAKKDGWCSDMTRTIFIGDANPFYKYAYEALIATNEAVEAMLKPGVTGKEAHEFAESILADWGFPNLMGHGLGHGVGREIHEEPLLNLKNDKPLEVGNVVTVEPGIYIPMGFELYAPNHGLNMSIPMPKFGMRLEDMGVITEDGFEVLTQSPHEAVILE
ncbi:MAG: M24 family metallopeptidase [Eggerthellaceae bacterium]|nr:M24 family metallopeptidase [Eggerthellaceae bacterium]